LVERAVTTTTDERDSPIDIEDQVEVPVAVEVERVHPDRVCPPGRKRAHVLHALLARPREEHVEAPPLGVVVRDVRVADVPEFSNHEVVHAIAVEVSEGRLPEGLAPGQLDRPLDPLPDVPLPLEDPPPASLPGDPHRRDHRLELAIAVAVDRYGEPPGAPLVFVLQCRGE